MNGKRILPRDGKDVICYGAGKYALDHYTHFEQDSPAIPNGAVCFADIDTSKHGTEHVGLPVYSLTEAISRYPNYDILVTVSPERTPNIVEYLLAQGIKDEDIFYYDFLEWRKGCKCLEKHSWIALSGTRIKPLSECTGGGLVIERTGNLECDMELCERERLIAREKCINGSPCFCDTCFVNDWDFYEPQITRCERNFIFESNYVDTVCNVRCCFCTALDERRYVQDKSYLKTGRHFIDDWRDLVKLYSNERINVAFANGEFTFSPWCDEVITDLEQLNWDCLFALNGMIYNERLRRLCLNKDNNRTLMFSMDCGTPQTFKKIRKVNGFDKFISNTTKYFDNGRGLGNVLKYIVLEGLNDNEEDIDAFVEFAKTLGCHVCLSVDNFTLPNPVSSKVHDAILYFDKKLAGYKIPYDISRHNVSASDYKWMRNLYLWGY